MAAGQGACSAVLFACAGEGTANTNPPTNENQGAVNNNNPSSNTNNTNGNTQQKPSEDSSENKDFVNDKTEVDAAREQTFFSVVNNSHPNVIVTQTNTTHSKFGTCVGYYRTTIFSDDNYSFYYEYEKFNKIGEGTGIKGTVGPHTIYYKDGKYSLDNEAWVYDHPDPEVLNVKLDLNKQYLGNYVISSDSTQLVAKLNAANAEKVLGIKIEATSNVEITIKTDGTHLWNIVVEYTCGETTVHIATSYTYEIISADAQ